MSRMKENMTIIPKKIKVANRDGQVQSFMTQKRTYGILAFTWTVAVVVLCLLPASEIPKVDVPMLDKVVHVIMFGGISFLWLKYFTPSCYQITGIVVILTIMLGLVIELLQASPLTTGRSFEVADLSSDAFGAVLAACLFWWQYGEAE